MSTFNPRSNSLLAWSVCLEVACAVILALRIWAARMIKRRVFADDVLVGIAYLATTCLFGLLIWAMHSGGFGKRQGDLTAAENVVLAKFRLSGSVTRLVANALSKLSVLFLYRRIFSTKPFTIWLNVVIAATVSYGITFFVLFLTRCRPISITWDPVSGGWCRNSAIEELLMPCFSLFFDLVIVLLPMPVLWNLQIPPRKKVAVSIMFGLGLITVGVMIWRVYAAGTSFRKPDYDPTYHMPDLYLIVMLELCLSIIAACVPTLAPLIMKHFMPILERVTTWSSKPQPQPPATLETIGAKPSRRMYQDLQVTQYQSAKIVYATDTTEWSSGEPTPNDLEGGFVHDKSVSTL